MKKWTLREIEYLRQNVSKQSVSELMKVLNVSEKSLRGTLKRNKIKIGRDTRFKRGQTSWNKGKSVRLGIAGEFKKGNVPHNTRADGDISIRGDKSGKLYKYIRVSKGKWVLLHRTIWESVYGEIPKGMLIVFKDGNTMNCAINNLEMISMRENINRNRNNEKASKTMKDIWSKEKLRKVYGISAKTGLGRRINNF